MSELKRYIWAGSYGMSEQEDGEFIEYTEYSDEIAKLKELMLEAAKDIKDYQIILRSDRGYGSTILVGTENKLREAAK